MYIGIDLGTSGVKVILIDEHQKIIHTITEKLDISRPKPLWSEQDPNDWWQATDNAMHALKAACDLSSVKAIGLSGQMHGATLLDSQGNILRPAILWNDGRCSKQCEELEKLVLNSREITGNLMMPGFTAPKLKWLAEYEPSVFKQIKKVLLPKDYLRFRMTNVFATDISDAAGTMWLDVSKRDWSDELLSACDVSREQMPKLYEGTEITGYVTEKIARRWGLTCIPVVAGGGDNAAGAVGVGLYREGQAMLSLGTSGVYFVVTNTFLRNTEKAVHSFCHALPNTWHLMSVMLSASSCLDWICAILHIKEVNELIQHVEQSEPHPVPVYFLPYLSGERTPHNNAQAKGAFFNLTMAHKASDIARSVIEGVSFALADCMDALHESGIVPQNISVIGGGSRSSFWCQLLSDISGKNLVSLEGGDAGPALGAAKLAQIACNPDIPIEAIVTQPKITQRFEPNQLKFSFYQEKRKVFNELYRQNLSLFSN